MELNEIRNKIDETDAALVELFRTRMQLSGEIVAYKMAHDMPILQPGREREVLLHVSKLAGPEFSNYARVLYATLMDLSRAYQNQFTMRDSVFKNEILEAAEENAKALSERGRCGVSRRRRFLFPAGLRQTFFSGQYHVFP